MAERLAHIPPNAPGSEHEHTGDLPIDRPNLPEGLNQFDHLEPTVTKNGAHRVYGVDADGKKHALSHDAVLEAYGHDPKVRESGDPSASTTGSESEEPRDVHEEFKEAVEADTDGAKDKTFRDWLKDTEQKAKWHMYTKVHANSRDDVTTTNIRLLNDDELRNFRDRSHQEALNKREGKDNPTEDDVAYYRWLESSASTPKAKPDGGTPGATDPTDPTELRPLNSYITLPNGTEGSDHAPRSVRYGSILARDALSDPHGQELLAHLGDALNRYTSLQPQLDRTVFLSGDKQQEIEQARQEYEVLRTAVNRRLSLILEARGYSAEDITQELMAQDMGVYMNSSDPDHPGHVEVSRGESGLVRDLTRQEAERVAKESRFIGWWSRQSGKLGFLKKAGVMLPVGLAAGAVGTALAPLVGTGLVAAGVGGFAGKRIVTGVMRSRVSNSANAATNARVHTDRRHATQLGRGADAMREAVASGNDGVFMNANVTSAHIEGARQVHSDNLKNVAIPVAAGIAAGAVAGEVAGSLLDNGSGSDVHHGSGGDHPNHGGDQHHNNNHDRGQHDRGSRGNDDPGQLADRYAHLNVASGSGFEDSLQNQYDLSDAQARGAYEAMRSDLQGASGTYQIGPGNIGISSAGDFQVPAAAQHDLEDYLGSIGKK